MSVCESFAEGFVSTKVPRMSSSSSTSSSATYILHHQLRPAPAPAQRSPLLRPLPVCEETAAAPPSAPPPDLLELSSRYEDILNRRWGQFCRIQHVWLKIIMSTAAGGCRQDPRGGRGPCSPCSPGPRTTAAPGPGQVSCDWWRRVT